MGTISEVHLRLIYWQCRFPAINIQHLGWGPLPAKTPLLWCDVEDVVSKSGMFHCLHGFLSLVAWRIIQREKKKKHQLRGDLAIFFEFEFPKVNCDPFASSLCTDTACYYGLAMICLLPFSNFLSISITCRRRGRVPFLCTAAAPSPTALLLVIHGQMLEEGDRIAICSYELEEWP